MTETCFFCRFFKRQSQVTGVCRRFPPVPRDYSPAAAWPIVHAEYWCGEFKLGKPGGPS